MNTRIIQNFLHDSKKIFTWPYLKGLVTNPAQLKFTAFLLLIAELLIGLFVVERVPYTEIDWKAYMQECEGFLNGTFDYSKLRGDTGPLVYPAGFVYIFSFFYIITGQGENIKLAQYIYLGIYLLQLFLVLRLYMKTKKVPPYVLVLTTLSSHRIHSIYLLRLFNDPVAVLFLYLSLNMFADSRWYLGSIFYSLGVSVKMNILLYAPALFFFYLVNLGKKETMKHLFVCGIIQLLLGLVFLINNPVAYLKGSFDLGRVFNHTWTVNYRFLDVVLFENKAFHLALLAIHIALLIVFMPMCNTYFLSYCRLTYVQHQVQPQIDAKNLECKRKNKPKKDTNLKSSQNSEPESLTKEEEQILNSFENIMKKTSQKSVKKVVRIHTDNIENSNHSVNYDVLSQLFIMPMFLVNFIGIVCARSLHYQFYSWYFHSLPYLLWSTYYSIIVRLLILALIELCWNVYPSTNFTSLLLHVCHLSVMFGVYERMQTELKIASLVP